MGFAAAGCTALLGRPLLMLVLPAAALLSPVVLVLALLPLLVLLALPLPTAALVLLPLFVLLLLLMTFGLSVPTAAALAGRVRDPAPGLADDGALS